MAGYRTDPFTGDHVLIASARRGLPIAAQLIVPRGPVAAGDCPFCPGHEAETEPTLAELLDGGGPWQARVVRNRFPLVSGTADATCTGEDPARGTCEVIVEAREHDVDLPDLPVDHVARLLGLYRDRARALETQPGAAFVCVFRNRGRRAGSSQWHPHAQAVAISRVPSEVSRRVERARSHLGRANTSLLAGMLTEARAQAVRIVSDDGGFVTLCPFAPHRAHETWVVPPESAGPFAHLDEGALAPLAHAFVRALRAVREVTGGADYNVIVRAPPPGVSHRVSPWWIEILPRTGGDAGFEIATGMDAVPVPPEETAARLRATVTPAPSLT